MTRIRIASFSPLLLVGALFFTSCKSQPAPATQATPANQAAPTQYQTSSQYQSPAQAGLQFINNPGGGQIFYGVVANQSTMNNAMIAMLRSVHAYFGVQPQIGQFFQSKGSDSIATFFTLNANVQGGGTKAISGLVIVSMPQGSQPLGGAMFDDAANFSKTQPAMMNALNQAWQTAAKNAPGAASPQAAPQPTSVSLRQATAGDRSASIGLAPGWQISGVAGGQLTASGPNGELIGLGLLYQGIHPPGAMQGQSYGASGPILVAPVGGDLFNSFVSVSSQIRQSRKLSVGTYKLISSQNIAPQTIQAIFEVDMHDGKGMRKGSARIGEIITRGLPTWAMTVSTSNAPETVFDAQNPTILAMIHSYSQNAAVIGQETQAVINNIHAIGARAAQQAADADSRRVASSQAFDQHMDDIDRSSKAFQNYQFDSSQLQVSGGGQAAHATVSNTTAAALVQSDPSRYQIVQSQDFIKGVDY